MILREYIAEDMVRTLNTDQDDRAFDGNGNDDSELICRLRSHDSAAFIDLYDRFNRRVFRFLLHMTGSLHESEELLQSVFASVWEGLSGGMFERFDANRGTLEGYLLGIARNAARKLIARRARITSFDEFDSSHGASEVPAAESGFAAIERESETRRMRQAIGHLPVEFREAIVLCCLQGLSYEHAAKVMNCSVGTVGSRVNRGKALLRKALSVPGDIPRMRSVAEAR